MLWWIPAGHIPSIEEAKARLEHLRAHGESAHTFSFRQLFPPPDAAEQTPIEDLVDLEPGGRTRSGASGFSLTGRGKQE